MGLVGSIGSTIAGGISGAGQANQEAKAAQANARISANQANVALDEGAQQAQRSYQEGDALLGALRAQMAANGVDISGGSALQVQQAQALQTGQNVGSDLYNSNAQAIGYRNQATEYDNQARAARYSGKMALIGAGVGAAAQVAGAAAGAFGGGGDTGTGGIGGALSSGANWNALGRSLLSGSTQFSPNWKRYDQQSDKDGPQYGGLY